MPNTQKIFAVQNLQEKVKEAKGIILTDFSGLKVDQISQLRREIKKSGGEFEVVKNNLLRLALENSSFKNITLEGPTAVLWLYQDDPSPLKILKKFIDQTELPKIKFGFWQKELLDEEKIKSLASLPGINELRGQLVSLLKTPLYRLSSSLNYNLWKLLVILKTKAEKGGEN
ncbi:MAG: 50S ribosomal protein L10 [Microgenomates group bacterium]